MPEQEDDEVRYTTDGTTPGLDSPQYTKPFSVVQTTVVKAIGIRNGISSDVAEKTFVKQSEGETTIAQIHEGKQSLTGATIRLTDVLVAYGETVNGALTYIIREGNKAINVTSNNADVSFKIGMRRSTTSSRVTSTTTVASSTWPSPRAISAATTTVATSSAPSPSSLL